MFRSILSLAVVASALLVAPVFADPHPKGFEPHKFNGSAAPVTEGGVTTFHIENGECSNVDFGDGRGESDCINGTVRSVFAHMPRAELGQTVEYRFDVRVDASLAYEGFYNVDSTGYEPNAWDSHLWLASWEGTSLHNFIYILKVSKKAGITFNGVQCQAPENLGDWVSFSMKVKWGGDDKAWVAVTCDDRYVYVAEDAPSNVAPACYVQNQCVVGEVRNPKSLLFIPGVKMNGWGHTFAETGHVTPLISIQPEGITAQMRNLAVTSGAVLYGPEQKALVVELQNALNALGCDVGAADGAPGKRTKTAALVCRKFADGAMPAALNVATLQTFVDLYTAEGVADLPPGELPVEPLAIHAFQQGSETTGKDKRVVADFGGRVTGDPSGVTELSFLVSGEFDYDASRLEWLSLILLDDVKGNNAVDACDGVRIEDWGDGGSHAVIEFEAKGLRYTARDMACLAENLPDGTAEEAAFLIGHFADLAKSLITDGTIGAISNDGLKLFLERVAAGEILVEAAPTAAPVEGLLPATYALDIEAEPVQVQDDGTLVVPLHADTSKLDVGFDQLAVLIIGKYSPALRKFSEFSLLLENGAESGVAAALGRCPDIRTEVWGDGLVRTVFIFTRPGDTYKARGASCAIAALGGGLGKEADFLFNHFSDIAVALVGSGASQSYSDPGLPEFFQRVATGELTLSK